jgi:hypothetical protein
MSGKKPSFITGATAKIQVGGKTFAYAQDVSYSVTVDTIPVETMGRYEAVTNEAVNYSVAGSLSVVRYTKVAGTNLMPGAAVGGNGLGAAINENGQAISEQMNPGNMLLSQTWDLAVFQKQEAAAGAFDSHQLIIKISDCRFNGKTSNLTKRGLMVDRLSFVGVLASDDSFTSSHSGDIDLQS